MIRYLLIIGTLFNVHGKLAMAYPNFIGFGYTSCQICHYNPFGNGPLTDYGRAVSATAIADRIFYSSKRSEDSIARSSGFLYTETKNTWFRPSIDYRGLYLVRNYNQKKEEAQIIHMQASGSLVLKFGKRDSFILVGEIGYAPKPLSKKNDLNEPNYRSREHYMGIRFTENFGIYLGLMDKVFGIRVPDHIAFSRSVTGLTMNDGTHGGLIHIRSKNWDLGLQGFMGNIKQEAKLRQKGFTGQFDYSFTQTSRTGVSFLMSESTFLKYQIAGAHTRLMFGKGNSVLAEFGQISKTKIASAKKTDGYFMFMQNHLKMKRGFFMILTAEYYQNDITKDGKIWRFGPGAPSATDNFPPPLLWTRDPGRFPRKSLPVF